MYFLSVVMTGTVSTLIGTTCYAPESVGRITVSEVKRDVEWLCRIYTPRHNCPPV